MTIRQPENQAVNRNLSEVLYQVQHETRFAGPIRMDESCVGVHPGQNDGSLDLAVQDAVTIVEHTVDRVGGSTPLPTCPAVFFGNYRPDRRPVALRGIAFRS